MKKRNIALMVVAFVISLGAVYGQTDSGQAVPNQNVPPQTDYSRAIIGTWKFDLGSGFMATIEYKSNGTFEQTVGEMIIGGTYVVNGDKLKTTTKSQTTLFTIVSYADNKMTIKRIKDGRIIIYKKQ
jgi:hypothetical protein